MKILISGTYCSGKTTLANNLLCRLKKAKIAIEPAGEIVSNIPKLDWSSGHIRTYLIVRQILIEKIGKKNSGLVICDGGIPSNIAHDTLFSPNLNNQYLLKELEHDRYDIVFFCNYSEIPFESNGLRMTDLQLRKKLSKEIHSVLLKLDYKPLQISGNNNERLQTSLKLLKEYKIISENDLIPD